MNRSVSILLIILTLSTCLLVAGEEVKSGNIQVVCEADVSIYLDDVLKGESTIEQGGLLLPDVSVGKHIVKAVKDGFFPSEFQVDVAAGKTAVVEISMELRKIVIEEDPGKTGGFMCREYGSLVIKTLPVDCTIEIPGLLDDRISKDSDSITLKNVPSGTYDVTLRWNDVVLKIQVKVSRNNKSSVVADFMAKTITKVDTFPDDESKEPREPGFLSGRFNRWKTFSKLGATDKSEEAVDYGLAWLADQQAPEGNWYPATWGGKSEYTSGICGLVLLAFLGAGHSSTRGRYQLTVRRAYEWLVKNQDAKGNFAPKVSMYGHVIPTLAVLEMYAMDDDPDMLAVAKKALDFMLSAQNDLKGWRYWPKDGESDTVVTTWCINAMHVARLAGIDFSEKALLHAKIFLDEVTDPETGEIGYTTRPIKGVVESPYQRYSMAACGIFSRLILDVPRTDKVLMRGVKILTENLPEWNQPGIAGSAPFYYYWFYGSNVMFQIGGDEWDRWHPKMRDMLVQHQHLKPGRKFGSWDPTEATHFCNVGGRIYSTAMAILTLETYYRYARIETE